MGNDEGPHYPCAAGIISSNQITDRSPRPPGMRIRRCLMHQEINGLQPFCCPYRLLQREKSFAGAPTQLIELPRPRVMVQRRDLMVGFVRFELKCCGEMRLEGEWEGFFFFFLCGRDFLDGICAYL